MSARDRNFGIAVRERNRRVARGLDDPYDTTAQGTGAADDAFFGSLYELGQRANDAGMGFRADFGDLGRLPGSTQGGGRLTATDRAGIAGNVALADYADQSGAQGMARDAYRSQRLGQIANELQAADEPRVVASAGLGVDTATPEGRAEFLRRLPMPLRAGFEKQFQDRDLAARGASLAERKQAEAERAAQANEAMQVGSVLPDDAIEDAALRYNKTGVMPTLGMRDPNNRQRILARAATMAREGGAGGADIATNAATFKSDTNSLNKLQAQRDAIGAFEETAKANMDVFLNAAKKAVDTGSPLLNQPVRAVSGRVLGSENQAEYDAARAVLLPEIARIITNPNLTGVLSDSAREEVSNFNPETATLGQTIKVMKLLKQDMGNRTKSLDDAIATVRGRMSKQPGGGGSAATEKAKAGSDPLGIR